MEGESQKALKYLMNSSSSAHNYGKLNKSESPRTHSSPTSILRKFPHSLRHDQKHQTKIKRDSLPVNIFISMDSSSNNNNKERKPKSWCLGDKHDEQNDYEEESEERPSSEDSDNPLDCKKRKFSEGSESYNNEVWRHGMVYAINKTSGITESVQETKNTSTEQQVEVRRSIECIKKLSVISTMLEGEDSNGGGEGRCENRKISQFPVHKSTPNLLRSIPSECVADRSSNGTAAKKNHLPLKASDSLPQLDQRYKIIHSILPKINRTISESHETFSVKPREKIPTPPPHVRSETQISSVNFYNSINRNDSKIFDVGGSDDDESEGLSLIDSQRSIIIQSPKDRKETKNRWSYKKTVDIMPRLRNLSRRIRGVDDASPPSVSAPLMTSPASPKSESCTSLNVPQIRYFDDDDDELAGKKCETVYALTHLIRADSTLQVEPMKAINRLRVPPNGVFGSASRMCSRCSSLLSMASSSRYSINTTGSGFVHCSSSGEKPPEPTILCKLCLTEVPVSLSMEINHCGCVFCKDCMRLYVEFEIQEGAYDISCPDAQCEKQGIVTIGEAEALVTAQMMERYLRFRLNHEVDMDRNRTWCPRAGCETVCNICPREKCAPTSVHCPTCDSDFCSNCKNTWHKGLTCEENSRKLAKEGRSDFMEPGIPFDSDSIKCCPMCNVPIEKDEGCAQMMCKRCKHVFCWYCLASLDDDFLLRHYDKGPCKNKLGHSRASVIWHRTQVIGIFAGLGLLLLVASPLLLLAAPCIVCCKCRVCSGAKLDGDEDLPEESGT